MELEGENKFFREDKNMSEISSNSALNSYAADYSYRTEHNKKTDSNKKASIRKWTVGSIYTDRYTFIVQKGGWCYVRNQICFLIMLQSKMEAMENL